MRSSNKLSPSAQALLDAATGEPVEVDDISSFDPQLASPLPTRSSSPLASELSVESVEIELTAEQIEQMLSGS